MGSRLYPPAVVRAIGVVFGVLIVDGFDLAFFLLSDFFCSVALHLFRLRFFSPHVIVFFFLNM